MTGLAIRIGGDVSGLDKAMQRASDIVSTRGKQMVSTAIQTGKAMDTAFSAYRAVQATAQNVQFLTTALKGAAVALGTVAVGIGIIKGLEAATRAAAEQVERVAKIGEAASSAGVSNSFYQVWTGQARNLKVETEDLTKSLERLKAVSTDKLGEGQEGKTRNESSLTARLRQQMEAGNISSSDLNRYLGASNTEQRLRVLLDLMRELQSKGRELAAVDIGSQFLSPSIIEGIRNGSIELDRLKQRLNDVKSADVTVFDDADIENAREMQRRLEEAYRIISNDLKPIYEDFARAGRDFYASTVSWVESLAGGVKLLAQAYSLLKSAAAMTPSLGLSAGNPAANTPAGKAGSRIGAIIAGKDVAPASPAAGIAERLGATSPDAVQKLQDLAKRMNPTATANDQAKSRQMTNGFFADKSAPIITTPKAGGGGGGGADTDRTTAVERYVAMLERARDVAKAEAETAGLGNVAREQAVALARAQAAAQQDVKDGLRDSATLTDAERAKIEGAAGATAKWKEEARQTQEALEFTKDLAGDALKGFIGDLKAGKSLADALKSALDRISTKVLDKLIDAAIGGLFGGGSGGFGFLGKLFGFADGGYTGNGGKYQPAGIVHAGEFVMSAAATRRIGVGNLDALHRGALRGYADGGLVMPNFAVPSIPGRKPDDGRYMPSGAVNQTVTVNVQGGSTGNPKQDQALADNIGKRVQVELRAMVGKEIAQQMRPNGILREAMR